MHSRPSSRGCSSGCRRGHDPRARGRRDGVRVPTSEWDFAVLVNPGAHHVTAVAPGYSWWISNIEGHLWHNKEVWIQLVMLPPSAPPSSTRAYDAEMKAGGIVATVLGTLGLLQEPSFSWPMVFQEVT